MTRLTDADVLATARRTGWDLVDIVTVSGYPHRVWRGTLAGSSTAFLVVDPNAVADHTLRQAILARHIAMFEQRCPACAARMTLPSRAARRQLRRDGKVGHGRMEHDPTCPVSDEAVAEAAAAARN